MHCDMCGNCNILRHFLLFPLLLSEPPEKAKNSNQLDSLEANIYNEQIKTGDLIVQSEAATLNWHFVNNNSNEISNSHLRSKHSDFPSHSSAKVK